MICKKDRDQRLIASERCHARSAINTTRYRARMVLIVPSARLMPPAWHPTILPIFLLKTGVLSTKLIVLTIRDILICIYIFDRQSSASDKKSRGHRGRDLMVNNSITEIPKPGLNPRQAQAKFWLMSENVLLSVMNVKNMNCCPQ